MTPIQKLFRTPVGRSHLSLLVGLRRPRRVWRRRSWSGSLFPCLTPSSLLADLLLMPESLPELLQAALFPGHCLGFVEPTEEFGASLPQHSFPVQLQKIH